MIVDCPECGSQLNVSEEAVGAAVRCPRCKAVFNIPDNSDDDGLSASIADWLDDEEDGDDFIPPPPQSSSVGSSRKDSVQTSVTDGPPERLEIGYESDGLVDVTDDDDVELDDEEIGAAIAAAEAEERAAAEAAATLNAEEERARLEAEVARKEAARSMPRMQVDDDAHGEDPGETLYRVESAVKTHVPEEDQQEEISPEEEERQKRERFERLKAKREAELQRAEGGELPADVVRLQLLDISAAGVTFRFPATYLTNDLFRASMPFQCVASEEKEPSRLIAKPLAWIDKAHGNYANPGELEQQYEVRVHAHQTARDIVASMRIIDELPPPFHNPVPYFVSREHDGGVTFHCRSIATPDGIFCEVTIPSAEYALRWLERVNGVCCKEYEYLEDTVHKLDDESWSDIPEKVRDRLAVWFDFNMGETFVNYFMDADFSRAEAGLAGIVLTDQRLVFCKYHHHGAFELADENVAVHLRDDDVFLALFVVQDGTRKKMVRLRHADVDQLLSDLKQLGAATFVKKIDS